MESLLDNGSRRAWSPKAPPLYAGYNGAGLVDTMVCAKTAVCSLYGRSITQGGIVSLLIDMGRHSSRINLMIVNANAANGEHPSEVVLCNFDGAKFCHVIGSPLPTDNCLTTNS